MLWLVVVTFAGILVPGALTYFWGSKSANFKKVQESVVTGLLGGVVVALVLIQTSVADLIELKEQIVRPNEMTRLDRAIETAGRGPFGDSLRSLRTRTGRTLDSAANGTIELEGAPQVVEAWGQMFGGARTSISATNYISEEFWARDVNFSSLQREVHQRALDRGVTIRRVFIIDSPSPSATLNELMAEQRGMGIEVRVVSRAQVEALSVSLHTDDRLGGAIDFVVYDVNTALVTTAQPDTRMIARAVLTNNRDSVDAAERLFEGIWQMAANPSDRHTRR